MAAALDTLTDAQPTSSSGARPPPVYDQGRLETLRAFQRDPLAMVDEVAERFGDVVEVNIGPRTALFLRHPEHVERVLVHNLKNYSKLTRGYRMLRKVLGWGLLTNEGAPWRRQRRIMQPGFRKDRIASFADTMVRLTDRMLRERWEPAAQHGKSMDVASEMMRVTLDIVSATLLGIESDERADEVGKAMPVVLEHVLHRITHPLSPHEIVPTPRNLAYRRSMGTLERIVRGIVTERRAQRASGQPADDGSPGDLLDMLIDARDEETGEGMTDQQLRDEVMTMYLAGHETTAMALSWTFHLLSEHPAWEAALIDEVRGVLGGRLPTLADLPRLTLTKRILQEAMRLYPPVWLLGRTAQEEDVIGGYRVKKGRLVFVSAWMTHRHPDYFPDPQRFDPDRFLPENFERLPKLAYYPFSFGQRKCIGDHFAMMEAQLILATVLNRMSLTAVPGHRVVPQTAVTLRPREGILMVPSQRAS